VKVAVTGCHGYVGGHLVDELLRTGHEVKGIDHREPPAWAGVQAARVELGEAGAVAAAARALRGCEAVFHLASRQPFSRELEGFVRGNIQRTSHLLQAMRLAGVGRLIHASTVAVYGRPERLPLREDTPLCPENTYEVTKREAERLVGVFTRAPGGQATVLRLSSVFGGRGRSGAMFSFVDAALVGRPIRLFAGGRVRRDHVHVADVVAAARLALDRRQQEPLEIYNVGGGEAPTGRELCDLIFQVAGRPGAIDLADDPAWRVDDVVIDISRARTALHYAPRSLRDGVADLVATLKKERS
jgi:nucleoside-diphosphate-sugar epimerase